MNFLSLFVPPGIIARSLRRSWAAFLALCGGTFRLEFPSRVWLAQITALAIFWAQPWAEASEITVPLEIGTGGGGNNQLSIAKSYTYNFGVTSAGDGLILDQIILGIGKQNNIAEGITFAIYGGFGGAVAGNELIASTTFGANSFTGASSTTNP